MSVSDLYGHGDEYRELLAYQLIRQLNSTTIESYEEIRLILEDMGCPGECEVWTSVPAHPESETDFNGTLYWYCSPVMVRHRGKTWLLTDKFGRKEEIEYFAEAADIRTTSHSFAMAFPKETKLLQDWAPF